ncbi:MAG TPA: acyltransferase family protein, partial [Anaerolineales bacterium]|nr:acyltransferase family protein [Anaerolineales bacterium]
MTSPTRLSYISGLDGIRGLAVLAVLCYHAGARWALGGFLGVETFFVLSGFLITSLLLAEWQASGRIDLKTFWLRRARRLLPAVWLLLVILPALAILFGRDALPRLREDIPAALFYVTNWVFIFREVPYFEAFGRPPLLQQLWSLAVEEQFYLLWPLILLILLRKLKNKRSLLTGVVLLMVVISSGLMAALYSPSEDPLRVYYGTDTRAAGFLVGAMLAMIWTPRKASQAVGRLLLEMLGWSGLVALLSLYVYLNEFRPFLYRGGILITALASALLIVGASTSVTSLSKLLESRILRWIGTRSYSIYLWHWPIFMLTRPGIDIHLPALPVRLGQLAITFGLAELSYRWIESLVRHHGFRSSFRLWRASFMRWPVPQKLVTGVGVFSAVLVIAWQGSAPLAERQADAIPALQYSPTAEYVTPTLSSSTLQDARSAPTPQARIIAQRDTVTNQSTPAVVLPENVPHVTFIGDSIMQGARPMMEDRLSKDIYIDAARKRRMEDVPALIETLAETGHLGSVVVIHLGSN